MKSTETLQPARVLETIERLHARINERFPSSGLGRVSGDLYRVAEESGAVWNRLRRPYWPLRVLALTGVALVMAVATSLVVLITSLKAPHVIGLPDTLQTIESGINDVVLLSLAIFFLATMEGRYKRHVALRNLHRLRSIVHIVDMHQLTKDPEWLFTPDATTPSSPQRKFTRFELTRYLDYCSELLSLSSKIAALHMQYMNDPVVLDAVNDIETLAASLSNSVWQKIMILDTTLADEPGRTPGL
ncbi:MAG: hypothetical protein ABIV28_04845 [Longimicrobiales bacterium]